MTTKIIVAVILLATAFILVDTTDSIIVSAIAGGIVGFVVVRSYLEGKYS